MSKAEHRDTQRNQAQHSAALNTPRSAAKNRKNTHHIITQSTGAERSTSEHSNEYQNVEHRN
jgi:hypothetical protein